MQICCNARSSFAAVVQSKEQDEDKDLPILYLQDSFQGRDEVAQRCSLASGQKQAPVIHCVGVETPRDGVCQPLTQCHPPVMLSEATKPSDITTLFFGLEGLRKQGLRLCAMAQCILSQLESKHTRHLMYRPFCRLQCTTGKCSC